MSATLKASWVQGAWSSILIYLPELTLGPTGPLAMPLTMVSTGLLGSY